MQIIGFCTLQVKPTLKDFELFITILKCTIQVVTEDFEGWGGVEGYLLGRDRDPPLALLSVWGYLFMQMASAGFIYCPNANEPDVAKCFFCLIELEGWEPDHDPWYV